MQISSLLHVGRGITALIGGGGKTTLMYTLAEELKKNGKVIITTSTKIKQPEQYLTLLDPTAEQVEAALRENRVLCVASLSENEKISMPDIGFDVLAKLADYVIVEADGARNLPLKAHASYEPVIPEGTQRVIMVIGIDGLGKRICDICHRPELYAVLAETDIDAIVTPEMAAKIIKAEGYGDRVYINKVESPGAFEEAKRLAQQFSCPVVTGSLHLGVYSC